MKALLLTPTFLPSLTGNAVTVERISRILSKAGVICQVLDLSRTPPDTLPDHVRSFQPDLLHVFHAFKAGPEGLNLKRSFRIPLITTLTGTDISRDIKLPGRKEIIGEVLRHSDWITVFNEQAKATLKKENAPAERVAVIHQSVCLPPSAAMDYRRNLQIGRKITLFLLLGAIRSIKNYPYALRGLQKVRKTHPCIHLILAGPVLEEEAFSKIRAMIDGRAWVSYIGETPRNRIRSLLNAADIILNTSASESESNAILEALSLGKIVIGRAIPGNASLLTEQTGFPFRNSHDFYEKIIHVLTHPDHLKRIRRQAKQYIQDHFHPDLEQAGYLHIYHRLQGP
jgi:L-malate glycosyltransferase